MHSASAAWDLGFARNSLIVQVTAVPSQISASWIPGLPRDGGSPGAGLRLLSAWAPWRVPRTVKVQDRVTIGVYARYRSRPVPSTPKLDLGAGCQHPKASLRRRDSMLCPLLVPPGLDRPGPLSFGLSCSGSRGLSASEGSLASVNEDLRMGLDSVVDLESVLVHSLGFESRILRCLVTRALRNGFWSLWSTLSVVLVALPPTEITRLPCLGSSCCPWPLLHPQRPPLSGPGGETPPYARPVSR